MTKQSQDLVKQEEQELQEWQKMQFKGGKKGHNTMKLDNNSKSPTYGKFYATRYELDPEEEQETWKEVKEEIDLRTAEFFPVKCRIQVIPPFSEGKPKYRIDETDDSYIEIKDRDGTIVEEGLYPELKEKYKLSYSQSAYCFYNGNCYKFIIKGMVNLESWFQVWGKIAKKPQTFRIIRMPEADAGTNVFYPLVFELTGNEVPLTDAVRMAREINANLAKYYEGKQKALEAEETKIEEIDYSTDLPFDKEKERQTINKLGENLEPNF